MMKPWLDRIPFTRLEDTSRPGDIIEERSTYGYSYTEVVSVYPDGRKKLRGLGMIPIATNVDNLLKELK